MFSRLTALILVIVVIISTSPAFSNVIMNWDSDSTGSVPVAANSVGVNSFVTTGGTSAPIVTTTSSWDSGANSATPISGSKMLHIPNDFTSSITASFSTIQSGNLQFTAYVHFAINDGNANSSNWEASEQKLILGSASTTDTSGQAISLVFRAWEYPTAANVYYKSSQLSWTSIGAGILLVNENDWFQLSGSIDTSSKKWSLTISDVANPADSGSVSNVGFLDSNVTELAGMSLVGGAYGAGAAEAYWDSISIVPEPSTLILLGTGIASLIFIVFRLQNRK